jgi:hypothetical protein
MTIHLRQMTQVVIVVVASAGMATAVQGLADPVSSDSATHMSGRSDCFYTLYELCDEEDTRPCGDFNCTYVGNNPNNPDYEDNNVWKCSIFFQYDVLNTTVPYYAKPATAPKNIPGYNGYTEGVDYWCYTRTPCAVQVGGCDLTVTEQLPPKLPIVRRICRTTTGTPQKNPNDVIKASYASGDPCKERS